MRIELNDLSLDQRKKIGNRIRGARIMSGLTQEEFAAKYSISLSTLKNFEIARVIPRLSTVISIISGIQAEGINVNENWVIAGRSNGAQGAPPSILQNDDSVLLEIEAVKQHFIKTGSSPVVALVKNNDMSPRYLEGDVLIGLLRSPDFKFPLSGQVLVEIEGHFGPYNLLVEGKSYFAVNNAKNCLLRIRNERIASIVWHRHYS
jgi:transcriptional regulator with XRE-family HTH domain